MSHLDLSNQSRIKSGEQQEPSPQEEQCGIEHRTITNQCTAVAALFKSFQTNCMFKNYGTVPSCAFQKRNTGRMLVADPKNSHFKYVYTYPISNKEPNHVSKKTINSQIACQKFNNINIAIRKRKNWHYKIWKQVKIKV